MVDKIVEKVKQELDERSKRGIAKYGTTLEREDLNFADWIQHLKEELLDAALYCEKLKREYYGTDRP